VTKRKVTLEIPEGLEIYQRATSLMENMEINKSFNSLDPYGLH